GSRVLPFARTGRQSYFGGGGSAGNVETICEHPLARITLPGRSPSRTLVAMNAWRSSSASVSNAALASLRPFDRSAVGFWKDGGEHAAKMIDAPAATPATPSLISPSPREQVHHLSTYQILSQHRARAGATDITGYDAAELSADADDPGVV